MYSDSPVYFTYPSLNLRSPSTESIITNLHIFLSIPLSCLLVAGWWLAKSHIYFPQPWECQHFLTHCHKCLIFVTCKETVTFGLPNPILRETGTEILKTHKTGTNIILRNIWIVKLGYDRFLTYHFQFIIHQSSCHSTVRNTNYW